MEVLLLQRESITKGGKRVVEMSSTTYLVDTHLTYLVDFLRARESIENNRQSTNKFLSSRNKRIPNPSEGNPRTRTSQENRDPCPVETSRLGDHWNPLLSKTPDDRCCLPGWLLQLDLGPKQLESSPLPPPSLSTTSVDSFVSSTKEPSTQTQRPLSIEIRFKSNDDRRTFIYIKI